MASVFIKVSTLLNRKEFTPGLTQTHTHFVSEGYAPIEQYLPQAKRSSATDIYGLAATLYTLLTGKVPIAAYLRDRCPLTELLDTPHAVRRGEVSINK